MCKNIRPLFNFDPPATNDEINAASLQFLRKISGFNKPSKVNEPVFDHAVDELNSFIRDFLNSLQTKADPKNREVELAKLKARNEKRFPVE